MEALLAGALAAALVALLIVVALLARARRDRRPLQGEHVIVNTPKPDDQSLRGFCVEELSRDRLRLTGAVYLEPDGRSGVVEVPAGDVVVPAYSWAQVIPPPPLRTER